MVPIFSAIKATIENYYIKIYNKQNYFKGE